MYIINVIRKVQEDASGSFCEYRYSELESRIFSIVYNLGAAQTFPACVEKCIRIYFTEWAKRKYDCKHIAGCRERKVQGEHAPTTREVGSSNARNLNVRLSTCGARRVRSLKSHSLK
jgi:hypothetical protein